MSAGAQLVCMDTGACHWTNGFVIIEAGAPATVLFSMCGSQPLMELQMELRNVLPLPACHAADIPSPAASKVAAWDETLTLDDAMRASIFWWALSVLFTCS